jgi:hypothetical protein
LLKDTLNFCLVAPVELGAVFVVRKEASIVTLECATLNGVDELCVAGTAVDLVPAA